jgi:transcriptional regulator with XRE-family HTH domain
MPPFQRFGNIVHTLRRKYHVTSTELSASLEVDAEYLSLLEAGVEKPNEDIVEQLIGYFSLDDDMADNLWLLAGYPLERIEEVAIQPVYVPPSEQKASYTDMVHVSVNNYGVTLNFMQNIGTNNQPIVVSRLGMSREHAQSVVDVLTRTLKASEQHMYHTPLALPNTTTPLR